jgi:type I restriction-modification system DNA methylase subunit
MSNNNLTNISAQSWQTLMWALHNDVRNSRGLKLTGMAALNEINNYLLLFFIERKFEKYHLINECKFSYMYKTFCTDEHIKYDTKHYSSDSKSNQLLNYYKVWNHWCNTQNTTCVLRQLAGSGRIQKYLQNEALSMCAFTTNFDTGKTIQMMINRIWKQFASIANSDDPVIVMNLPLESFGFDAFGDAYEKFKLDLSSNSGKTTGQHFTPDIVKSYIVNELKPKYNELFYEPACGTGGFIHHAAKYVKDNETSNVSKKKNALNSSSKVEYKNDEEKIEEITQYEYFVRTLTANECNPEIYKPLAINMLIHDIPIEKIRKRDSLDIMNIGETFGKYNIICANPPFGAGDQVNIYDDKYWGPLKTGKKVIKDAMAQFIMHMYQSLLPGGRCGTVSDRGIINNGTDSKNAWQTKLRKFLLENTNLYRIVLLPKETFEYTTFATCILFFNKDTNGTSSVEYRELSIKEVIIDGQKTKTINEDKILGTITIEQIKSNNYSLKSDDYFKIKEVKQDMDQWIKLGDICKLIQKSKHKAGDAIENGEFNFYTSSNIIKKSNYNDYQNETLILGSGGNGSLFIDSNFSCSADNFLIQNKTTDYILKYIYYYLKLSFYKLYKLFKGNGLKHLSQTDLLNYLIPNIPLDHQTEIVEFLDKQFEMYQINKLNKQIPLFDLLIKKEWNIATELIHLVYRQMATVEELANIKRDIGAIFGLSVYGLGNKCQMMKLGDVVDINPNDKHNYEYINYIDIGSIDNHKITNIQKIDDNFPSRAKRCLKLNDIIVSSVRPNLKKISIIDINENNLICSTGFCVIRCNSNINCKYIYELIKSEDVTNYLVKNSGGNSYPAFNQDVLKNLEIPVPSLEIQEDIINKINKLNEQSSHYDTYAKFIQTELDNITETIQNMTKNQI